MQTHIHTCCEVSAKSAPKGGAAAVRVAAMLPRAVLHNADVSVVIRLYERKGTWREIASMKDAGYPGRQHQPYLEVYGDAFTGTYKASIEMCGSNASISGKLEVI